MIKFINSRLRSFGFAFRGIKYALRTQPNFVIHICAAAAVHLLGWTYEIEAYEWIAIWICIGIVFTAEAFNTSLEKLVDMVQPNFHPKAGVVKDVAAAAVLFAAITAAVVGIYIFYPRIF